MVVPSSTPEEQALFQPFLDTAKAATQGDDSLQAQVLANLQARFDNPNPKNVELSLGHAVPVARLRQLLYWPDAEEDMPLYPQLLRMPPPDAPADHPQLKAQAVALTSIYLVHTSHWRLMRPFIEAGGLHALVPMLIHPNLHLRGQAFGVLESLTREDLHAWHPPDLPAGGGADLTRGPDGGVWRQMLSLTRSNLVKHLIAQYESPFPGASGCALRLLGFYASWLRYCFTPTRVLQLSQELLDLLERWAVRTDVDEAETELAGKLLKDFATAGPAVEDSKSGSALSSGRDDTRLEGDLDLECQETTSRVQLNSLAGDNEAEALKDQGNLAFGAKMFTEAVRLYGVAIDALVPQHRLMSEGQRRAVYHTNRAAAYLARSAAGCSERDSDENGHLAGADLQASDAREKQLRAALLDCDASIEFDRGYAKAHYRKGQALEGLGEDGPCIAALQRALACDGITPAMRTRVEALMNDVQRRTAGVDMAALD